eukprot:CAMPEP_0202460010 /NCGR_PEP_ID=MMETSP1360-20130828/40778_1 /ASSEMBLY_ACC=CAM_ASM_000848 /TAXON_ID=515479 /ORGANISM="Licmophora paradoxa, Strain CCMP2313" /LENGTH=60 /DNA_ID=CAMNT_0049081441 /DNA_START=101 /DNA_END=280 /DNA_ORIENTATION=+
MVMTMTTMSGMDDQSATGKSYSNYSSSSASSFFILFYSKDPPRAFPSLPKAEEDWALFFK